ncbi:unnamed protein product [Onchocerca ochengi]|uniref:Ras-associating domain-containing protein n=2 Tax=Onchocerca TaxID=6281 RepID=A0A182E4P3_ONCOC|nr:unnamed protein product [Onchocerca ochengi]
MEIKVIVDGIERSVSGITNSTTCAQIIYALAHATGQKGRFVLVEKFRNMERSLAPLDRPLEMLRKWGTHSHCVIFLLKHLDEDPSPVTSETSPVDIDDRVEISQLEEPSFTSVDISVPRSTHNYEENRGVVSSTALFTSMPGKHFCGFAEQLCRPAFSSQAVTIDRIRSRPPPPAYHELIEQRFTSLSRQNTPSSSLTPLQSVDTFIDDQRHLTNDATSQSINRLSDDILTRTLSIIALEELIQKRKQFIDRQKNYLAQLDLAIDNDQQREVVQLRRQQENLRAVLNPLRECDWPNRLQHERTELQKITASINEFEQKYDALTNEIKLRIDEEQKLKCRIEAVKEELRQLENSTENGYCSIITTE